MKVPNNTSERLLVMKLGEVCTYSKGKKPVLLKTSKTKDCAIPYVNIKAFEKGIFDEYTNGEKCNVCADDDLLMVWDGARCGLIGKAKKGAVGSTLMKILPTEIIHKEYLYHFISSKFTILNTKPKGVGIPHIEPTLLWNFELVVPSISQQALIVSKIEELLSKIENGKQQLQTALQQLKVYRQSLLKAAFEGKLTNKNVKDGELPEGWKWVKLKDVASDISDGDHQAPPKSEAGIPFITISNVNKTTNKIDFTDTFKVNIDYYKNLKVNRRPQIGDVLYTVTGSFGISILIDYEKEFCFQRHIGLVRPLHDINQKWIYYLLQSPQVFNQAKETATGTAQKTVALSSLRNFKIPFCTSKEQLLLVQELESKLTVCDKIEETITQSLQQAETLRQSILKKAFEGKLVNFENLVTETQPV
jgi:type I restriction enzyme, S subunit